MPRPNCKEVIMTYLAWLVCCTPTRMWLAGRHQNQWPIHTQVLNSKLSFLKLSAQKKIMIQLDSNYYFLKSNPTEVWWEYIHTCQNSSKISNVSAFKL